jgi:beta-lactamase regulating signal transducer with metallopeptidase domain
MASDRITPDKAIVEVALLIANLVLGPVLWVVGAMIASAMMIAERAS